MLDQVLEYLVQNKPDVMVIAGDVYDRAVPPEDAVMLLDRFISRAVGELGIPLILIGGNHDGQQRLGFASGLMQGAGLHVVGAPTAEPAHIVLQDAHGPVHFYPLPFLTHLGARDIYHEADIDDHHQAMARALDGVRAIHPADERAVLIAHAFVAGGAESESERLLGVGGAYTVDPALFEGFDYVALGHLHQPQSAGAPHIRYAGSLMKYSFSEVSQRKSMTLVELGAEGYAGFEEVRFTPQRDVRDVAGSIEEILERGLSDPRRDDYVRAIISDSGALLEPHSRIRQVYPNLLALQRSDHDRAGPGNGPVLASAQRTPAELFRSFFEQVRQESMSDSQAGLIDSIIDSQLQEDNP